MAHLPASSMLPQWYDAATTTIGMTARAARPIDN
jgi:hypothetical protein